MLWETRPWVPSYTQALTRIRSLLNALLAVATPTQRLPIVVDFAPIPVCPNKRGATHAFPGARWGWTTEGQFFCFKRRAWVAPSGKTVQSDVQAANLRDRTLAFEPNRKRADFGGFKVVWSGGHCGLGSIFPPRHTTTHDMEWRTEVHGTMRSALKPSLCNWPRHIYGLGTSRP